MQLFGNVVWLSIYQKVNSTLWHNLFLIIPKEKT